MAATPQQRLDALNDAYLRIVNGDAREWSEGPRHMGFHSLKEMGDEIRQLEQQIAASLGRRCRHMPMKRVDA